MDAGFDAYRSLIDTETRFMCDLVSPGFDLATYPLEAAMQQQEALKLLETLKRHRLYPAFYNVWRNLPKTNDKNWQQFDKDLKQLVEANRIRMIQKTTTLVQVVEVFEKERIPMIALKGPAMAQMLYGDVGMKASIDLDILININDWDKAVLNLKKIGFIYPETSYELNNRQKKYLFNNFNHIELDRPDIFLLMELHWALHSNKHIMEISFGELYGQSRIIELANVRVPILGPLHHALFLMTHGALHQWARLDWLYDWTMAMLHNSDFQLEFKTRVERLGLEIIKAQSFELSHLFFGARFDVSFGQIHANPQNSWFLKKAVNAIGHDYNQKFKPFSRIQKWFHDWTSVSTDVVRLLAGR